jgi:hypothetical protein
VDKIRERWAALCSSDQQKILDKHRYELNFDGSWWQDIYDRFAVDINEHGYMVNSTSGRGERQCIWFSGFGSRGDGACFDGYVWGWAKVLEKYPALLSLREEGGMKLSWESRGNYSYSNTLVFSDSFEPENNYSPTEDRLRYLARESLIAEAEAEWGALVNHTMKHVKELCDGLYRTLETENDWLSDDEQVLETLIASEMLGDELKEYEDDDDDDEQESSGPTDCCTDSSTA